jgi:hypothetical protein
MRTWRNAHPVFAILAREIIVILFIRGKRVFNMKLESTNGWIKLVANVGVIAGIVFLAFELQQNNKQLVLQSYQSWVAANLEINASLTDPALSGIMARGHEGSINLSDETYIAYAMQNMSMMQMAQSTHYLYMAGSLDEELWDAEMNRAAGILALPGVRQWWDAGGKTQLTPGFVEFLESIQSNMDTWYWEEGRGYFKGDGLAGESHEQ